MRKGLALSIAVHGGLLAWVLLVLASPKPYESTPDEAITVDVLTPAEVPKPLPPEPQPEKSEAPPAEKSAAAASPPADAAAPPSPAAAAAPNAAAAAPSETPVAGLLDPAGLLAMYNLRLPEGTFDAKAETQADLNQDEIGAFRAHLRKCWRPASALGAHSGTRVVIRVALTPDGALAGEPMLVEAGAASDGVHVMQAAMQALEKCQPYSFLPRDRYSEWKQLDVSFSAREMSSGR